MQQHEILAWLGNDHTLTDEQLDEFTTAANQIEQQYPDPDDQDEAQAALIAAYRLLVEDHTAVVRELSTQLASARCAEMLAVAGLKQAANQLIDAGQRTEAGFAREAGVDRMTVRAWRGKTATITGHVGATITGQQWAKLPNADIVNVFGAGQPDDTTHMHNPWDALDK